MGVPASSPAVLDAFYAYAGLIRSATDFVSCLFRRQRACTFVMGLGLAYGWYHAGRVARTPGESLIAASVASLGPLEGGSHDCRKVLITAIADVPCGAVAFIRMSETIAHVCLEGVRFR